MIKFICQYCPAEFASTSELTEHIRHHQPIVHTLNLNPAETVIEEMEREAFAESIAIRQTQQIAPGEISKNQEYARDFTRLKQILMDWRVEIVLRPKTQAEKRVSTLCLL